MMSIWSNLLLNYLDFYKTVVGWEGLIKKYLANRFPCALEIMNEGNYLEISIGRLK